MTRFVLVPGAWLGGWVWDRVAPLLEDEGHEAISVTLTGMGDRVHLASKEFGIETTIQDVMNVVRYEDLKDVVLVGHSFAGKVVAAVADRAPDEVRLVLYLDAFRPQKVRIPQGAFDTSEFGPTPPDAWTLPLTEPIVDVIGKDVVGEDRTWLMSKATPWPKRYASEPIALSEMFDSIKSAYIFCTGSGDDVDEILKGRWGRIDGPYKVIDAGHWPMITKPEELARDLISLSS